MTWARFAVHNTANVRYIFLIGGGWTGSDVTTVQTESAIYGDILQEDYVDSYYNLSYKVLSGFKWAVDFCPRAKFVVRSADDMYLNIPRILNLLQITEKVSIRKQIGFCYKKASVTRNR